VSSGFAAPRAAVTTRGGGTFTGRTFTGRTGTFAGRSFAGHGGGHWVWRNHRRVFVPFAAGVGLGLAFGAWGPGYYDDECVAWNGWRWVNVCWGPYAWGY
jgi:hypothetical protein